jgi:hypothetical protein
MAPLADAKLRLADGKLIPGGLELPCGEVRRGQEEDSGHPGEQCGADGVLKFEPFHRVRHVVNAYNKWRHNEGDRAGRRQPKHKQDGQRPGTRERPNLGQRSLPA